MAGWDLVIVACVLVAYATVSRRLRGTVITAAIVFVAVGYLFGSDGIDIFKTELGSVAVRHLAEVTLAVVLFSDASSIKTQALIGEAGMPARLLGIGLPLTIVLGALVAIPLFPSLTLIEALVLAVLLAPTDAALGQAVVSDERLPSRLRQGLNVESGLNDGLCVPILFAALAAAEYDEGLDSASRVLVDLVKEIGVAVVVGVLVAVVVVALARQSLRREWIEQRWIQILPLATATISYAATVELGGSGFIGSFVAGLIYGRLFGSHSADSTLLMEDVGDVLSAVTFLVFGAAVIGPAITDLDISTVAYSVLSLTLVRMIPVGLALMGRTKSLPTMLFAGWFGPRGLASIVFMLTVLQESGLSGTPKIVQVTTFTVLLSVFAHGMTATPLTDLYVRRSQVRVGTSRGEEPA